MLLWYISVMLTGKIRTLSLKVRVVQRWKRLPADVVNSLEWKYSNIAIRPLQSILKKKKSERGQGEED